jgi:cysteine desulfurase
VVALHVVSTLMMTMHCLLSNSLQQASRLCSKQVRPAALLRTSTFPRNATARGGIRVSSRGYVSETKKGHAQVSVGTAIRGDQTEFFTEAGKLPENVSVQSTNVGTDSVLSPVVGMLDRTHIWDHCLGDES